ncbi:hypothetical protein KDW41_25100 [Burkholderia vietnamiensis]|nr:hypothetical protein [Burkholderia vietnamiensis]
MDDRNGNSRNYGAIAMSNVTSTSELSSLPTTEPEACPERSVAAKIKSRPRPPASSGQLAPLENLTRSRESERTETRPRHMFADLKQLARKTLKFQQRKSVLGLSHQNFAKIGLTLSDDELASLQEGTCESLALGWLAAKLQMVGVPNDKLQSWGAHSNRGMSHLSKMAPNNDDSDVHAINANIMLNMARADVDAERRNTTTHSYFDSMALSSGGANSFLKPEVGIIDAIHGEPNDKQIPVHQALKQTCAILHPGTGANINVTILDINNRFSLIGRHSVSVYRDSQSRIHFFDPNIGEYEVADPNKFFGKWEDATAFGRGWRLEILTEEPNPDDVKIFSGVATVR